MNSLLDMTFYDKRKNKVKGSPSAGAGGGGGGVGGGGKRLEKTKAKSKSMNRIEKIKPTIEVVVPPKKQDKVDGKSHKNALSNNNFGSVVSLISFEDNAKILNRTSDLKKKAGKTEEIDPKQLRKKKQERIESSNKIIETRKTLQNPPPNNPIQEAINGFNYTGSIELKFEEALEVCAEDLYDEVDEEFGRNLFDDDADNYILEAYNRPGDELVETYMEIEHRTADDVKSVKKIEEKMEKLTFVSDEEECIFIEAYNSIGHELRKTYSLIDKKSGLGIDPTFQARTLSITSDVQEYFNEIGKDCENEEQLHPSANTYMNYSRAIDEYKTKQCNSGLLQKEEVQKRKSSTLTFNQSRDVEVPRPSPAIIMNYNRTMEELRRSTQFKKSNLNREAVVKSPSDDDGDADSITSSKSSESADEAVYEIPAAQPSPKVVKFTPTTKSDFIIHELLETELVYINNLKKILTDYLPHFRKFPEQSQRKVNTIFGNIEEIYRQTIEFYQALLMCSNDYETIAMTFVDYKNLFGLYPIYMKNKPKADRILLMSYKAFIEDRQKKLRDRLDLMSYLLNPIQRLGRYILLLENLQKAVRKADRIDLAVEILKANMKKGNDAIAVESIQKTPDTLDLYAKGSYIDREKFTMIKPRRQEIVIFLFEEIVVFTVENVATRNDVHTTFTYNNSIEMNDLSMTIVDGEMQTFQLTDYPKCKKNKEEGTYIFEARDRKTRDNWGALIQRRLWEQLEKFKDQSKSYKTISRANSTSSAKFNQIYYPSTSTASTSVSRENSTKSTKSSSCTQNKDDRKAPDKSSDKVKRRARKQKSDAVKRTSRFYTDPQNYKTM